MKLRSLAVNQFKKFTVPMRLAGIENGLNVVVGPNEMGKSTPSRCPARSPLRKIQFKGPAHRRLTE